MAIVVSLILGMVLTFLALALAVFYIAILVIGAGRLATVIEQLLKKFRQTRSEPESSPARSRGTLK